MEIPAESIERWIEAQESLKGRLLLHDDFEWVLPSPTTQEGEEGEGEIRGVEENKPLRYVGGVDLSFSKNDPTIACGALVVLDITTNAFDVVYHDYSVVRLQIPYIPGFLAFREAPVLLELLEKMRREARPFFPQLPSCMLVLHPCQQLLMVDGNGLLHPRGFGLACHLGVLANLPTIGIGKNLHHVDGLNQSRVRQLLEAKENTAKDLITLTGYSGRKWGVAMRSTHGSLKPVFISVGHRISLDTAVKVVKMICKYRVPEPIRQADIRSRAFLQNHPSAV